MSTIRHLARWTSTVQPDVEYSVSVFHDDGSIVVTQRICGVTHAAMALKGPDARRVATEIHQAEVPMFAEDGA